MQIGDVVAAKYSQGGYYLARILSVSDEGYEVIYADGDTGSVSNSEIFSMSHANRVKIGDRVLAVWQGARMYPGVVVDIIDGGAASKVQWDDGSMPLFVPTDKIAKLPFG